MTRGDASENMCESNCVEGSVANAPVKLSELFPYIERNILRTLDNQVVPSRELLNGSKSLKGDVVEIAVRMNWE